MFLQITHPQDHTYMYLKLTYFFDPICLHSLILRFKKKEMNQKKIRQIKAAIA